MDEVEQDTSGFMPVIGVIEVSHEIRRFRHLLFYFFCRKYRTTLIIMARNYFSLAATESGKRRLSPECFRQ
jgi:hypothetical protein